MAKTKKKEEPKEEEKVEEPAQKDEESTEEPDSEQEEPKVENVPKFWKTFMGEKEYSEDSLPEYYQKMEEGYSNSWAEGQRLYGELKQLKSQPTEEEPKQQFADDDYALIQELKLERQNQMNKAWLSFVSKHGEVANDTTVLDGITYLAPTIKTANPTLSYEDTLEKAYDVVKNPVVQQKIQPKMPQVNPAQAQMAEQGTSTGNMPPTSAPKESKQQLSEDEKLIASKLNLTDEEMLEGKELSKQAKK